jgi:hypothetical protein
MIEKFVTVWNSHKNELRQKYEVEHPDDYDEIVLDVVNLIAKHGGDYRNPDAEKMHIINDGDYQGTALYIFPEDTYQPNKYWYVCVDYGSCSGCDTLEHIKDDYSSCWGDRTKAPNKKQTDAYMSLALHIVQGFKEIDTDSAIREAI